MLLIEREAEGMHELDMLDATARTSQITRPRLPRSTPRSRSVWAPDRILSSVFPSQ